MLIKFSKYSQCPTTIETRQLFKSPRLQFGFVTETWLTPEIKDPEVFQFKRTSSIIARRDCSDSEHVGVFRTAEKDFNLNYSELTLKIDQTLKIGQINDFDVATSVVFIQSSHMFLLMYNPQSTSAYCIETKLLADWIFSCQAKFDINVSNCYFF